MGKGRKPCCDKEGVKKGSWSEAEDLKLISFIQKHGHSNWRALPKLAGLARCGKSCRLRWVNYLRPDIKRGNFTPQEEETIIKLHEALGNRWSKIASHFRGRTDNEIKNVWNTHLKKRIKVIKEVDTINSKNHLNEDLNINNKDSLQQILVHQTSSIDITSEQLSSPSTSYGSFSNFQKSDINPSIKFDKGVSTHFNVVEEDVCHDMDGIGTNINEIDTDLVDGLLNTPFEPNLDLWDLLDEDSNSTTYKEVQFNEHEGPPNPISTNENNNNMELGDGSWWWLVYLENELGLIS